MASFLLPGGAADIAAGIIYGPSHAVERAAEPLVGARVPGAREMAKEVSSVMEAIVHHDYRSVLAKANQYREDHAADFFSPERVETATRLITDESSIDGILNTLTQFGNERGISFHAMGPNDDPRMGALNGEVTVDEMRIAALEIVELLGDLPQPEKSVTNVGFGTSDEINANYGGGEIQVAIRPFRARSSTYRKSCLHEIGHTIKNLQPPSIGVRLVYDPKTKKSYRLGPEDPDKYTFDSRGRRGYAGSIAGKVVASATDFLEFPLYASQYGAISWSENVAEMFANGPANPQHTRTANSPSNERATELFVWQMLENGRGDPNAPAYYAARIYHMFGAKDKTGPASVITNLGK